MMNMIDNYDFAPAVYYVYDGISHDCICETLAINEMDALQIAAASHPNYLATEMYAIAASEF